MLLSCVNISHVLIYFTLMNKWVACIVFYEFKDYFLIILMIFHFIFKPLEFILLQEVR